MALPAREDSLDDKREVARFVVMFGRASTRVHKRWEGDGVLICYPRRAVLVDDNGIEKSEMSITGKRLSEFREGLIVPMGGLELQIQERDDDAGPSFTPSSADPPMQPLPAASKKFTRPVMGMNKTAAAGAERRFAPPATPHAPSGDVVRPSFSAAKRPLQLSSTVVKKEELDGEDYVPVKKAATAKSFVSPLAGQTAVASADLVVVNEDEVCEGAAPVTLHPLIGRHLRPHQKEGVRFIWERLRERGCGAILADDMGLGKSVQTIAATWAVIAKSPTRPVALRCALAVPSSLVNNWKCEFKKWFGAQRIPVLDVRRPSDIRAYARSAAYNPYLLISYDMALRHASLLAECRLDVLVCDEAHRLKNMTGKLRHALDSLGCGRRLLLTGTPIQNHLDEFYSLLDFARPGQFGTLPQFRAMCAQEGEEAGDLIGDCMLRRTAEVNTAHLPEKNEYVLFCRASQLQRQLITRLGSHMTADPLILIDMMRKLCNHPAILYKRLVEGEQSGGRVDYSSLLSAFPRDYGVRPCSIADSGKLTVVVEMLGAFRILGECAVVVSNYTKTLDMLSMLCASLGLRVFRLDGQTPLHERQNRVQKFNQEKDENNVFLLSSKAGGVGLNLIGASRLVLYDSDWNPAGDLQAMARIWRDGQTRPCHIYRLVTTGTIDEKILQRQIKKTGLGSVIDENAFNDRVSFSDEELADIFSLSESECRTHDLLGCACGGDGVREMDEGEEEFEDDEEECVEKENDEDLFDEGGDVKEEEEEEEKNDEEPAGPASMASLLRWRHFSASRPAWSLLLKQAGVRGTELTYAFHLNSNF